MLGRPEIKREKMGCLLAVTQGSARAAALHRHRVHGGRRRRGAGGAGRQGHHLRHRRHLAQGPAGAMDEMKFDMSGAAERDRHAERRGAQLQPADQRGRPGGRRARTCRAAAPSSPATSSPAHVGLDGGDPQHRRRRPPHPVRRAHYARRFKPAAVIDIATLTGAMRRGARPRRHAGCSANNDALARELLTAGVRASTTAPGTCRSRRTTRSS